MTAWITILFLLLPGADKTEKPQAKGELQKKIEQLLRKPASVDASDFKGSSTADIMAAIPSVLGTRRGSKYKPSGKIAWGKEREYYLYDLPDDYTPERAWPLIVSLHGNPPRHCERVHHKYWRKEPASRGYILVSPNLDGGRWHKAGGDRALLRALRDASGRFHVDSRRVYLNGYSAGGSGTWRWGTYYSDLFAAIIVRCGIRRVDNATLRTNLKGRGVYLIHATKDSKCPVKQAREAARMLKRYNINHVYKEFPGDHDFYWSENQKIFTFLEQFSLSASPQVDMVGSFRKFRMVGFVAVEGRTHHIRATLQGNVVELEVSNPDKLQRLQVYLPHGTDWDQPVSVRFNGAESKHTVTPTVPAFIEAWRLHPFPPTDHLQQVFTGRIVLVGNR
jgi:hypothetical protein